MNTRDVFWQGIQEQSVPTYLLEDIHRTRVVAGPHSDGTKPFARSVVNKILFSSIYEENQSNVTPQGTPATPASAMSELEAEIDPALLEPRRDTKIQQLVDFEGKPRMLSGVADTVWYDSPQNSRLATNFIIIEAEELNGADVCVPRLTACMGAVHALRKQEGKKSDATVYGLATDGLAYRFCRIDSDGKWSKRPLWEFDQHDEAKIYSAFRYLVGVAALSCPSKSPVQDPSKRRKILVTSTSSEMSDED